MLEAHDPDSQFIVNCLEERDTEALDMEALRFPGGPGGRRPRLARDASAGLPFGFAAPRRCSLVLPSRSRGHGLPGLPWPAAALQGRARALRH